MDQLEPYWLWLALGLLLAAAEMLAPGFFLIWLAGAALLTGAAAYLLPLGLGLQVLLFAVLAAISWYKHRLNISRILSGEESRIGAKG